MKKISKLLIASFFITGTVFGNAPLPNTEMNESNFFTERPDTVISRALTMLQENMDHLKNIRSKSLEFKQMFLGNSPTYPCDYCPTPDVKDVSTYAFDAANTFGDNFEFDYDVRPDQIEFETFEKGRYLVRIPVKKKLYVLKDNQGQAVPDKGRTVYLIYEVIMDYRAQKFGFQSVKLQKAPSSELLMLELNPSFRLSGADYASQPDFRSSSASSLWIRGGVVYYFNPFSVVNSSNVWFKTGLRLSYLNRGTKSNLVRYVSPEVELNPGQNFGPHLIDLENDVRNVKETVNSFGIEIPIGISKRFSMSANADFAIEFEMSYTIEFIESVSGSYELDQLGTNHLLNNDIQSASGGNPVRYDKFPQAVQSANGDVINFFRGNVGLLDDNETNTNGYLTFSLRPSIMLRKYEAIKHQIGINISYFSTSGINHNITEDYFNPSRQGARPVLADISETKGNLYLGVFFCTKL